MRIEGIKKNQLHTLNELWLELNRIHLSDSLHFKDHFRHQYQSFEKRLLCFDDIPDDKINIDVAYHGSCTVGYCISSARESRGEIESLFLSEQFRGEHIGYELVERSLSWLRSKGCSRIEVGVSAGHESVFGFYEKFGFYPRITMLRLKG